MSKTKKTDEPFFHDDPFTPEEDHILAREVQSCDPKFDAHGFRVGEEIAKVSHSNELPDRTVLILDDNWNQEYFKDDAHRFLVVESASGSSHRGKIVDVVFDLNRVGVEFSDKTRPKFVFGDKVRVSE